MGPNMGYVSGLSLVAFETDRTGVLSPRKRVFERGDGVEIEVDGHL